MTIYRVSCYGQKNICVRKGDEVIVTGQEGSDYRVRADNIENITRGYNCGCQKPSLIKAETLFEWDNVPTNENSPNAEKIWTKDFEKKCKVTYVKIVAKGLFFKMKV